MWTHIGTFCTHTHTPHTLSLVNSSRLHTVIERIIEEVSFDCDKYKGQEVKISEEDVKRHLSSLLVRKDLHRLVL
jgi:ATP-dependent HslUV protease ATP-binding subunit HslU